MNEYTYKNNKKTLYWLQSGGCSGDSMSILNNESPELVTFFEQLNIEVLWHPSLSNISYIEHDRLLEALLNEEIQLDILCIEGNIVQGPEGTGMFDTFRSKPKKDLFEQLAHVAQNVVAVGTCASFGGIGSYESDEMQGIGVQHNHDKPDGYLPASFRSKSGMKVVNLPGCPIHPKALEFILLSLVNEATLKLDKHQRPLEYYDITVHQGCTRNEHHEYRVEETIFGEEGCMFFHLGCKGPITHASCNKYLWNEVNSKTRAGVPCFGCTDMFFPHVTPFFETQNIAHTPLNLPEGVDRVHYVAYKDMAAEAAPDRLKYKKIERYYVKKENN